LNDNIERDPRLFAIPDIHGHCKGEHKPFVEERPLPLTARMLFLWFFHACKRGYPRFLMVADHMNYLTFEDPAAVNLVRRALKLAQAGDLYGAAETAGVDVGHAAVVSEGLRRGMRFSIGAEVDNDPRSRPDAQNIVDAMRPDATIRSVHFLPITHPVHGENWSWPFDNPEFKDLFDVVGTDQTWELYMTALIDAIERLSGQIVGHFYVPAVFGHWPDETKLEEYENRMLDAAAARGMAVEFNTRFLYRDHPEEEKARYLAANTRLLRKAKERNVGIAIGSDAHSPRDQGGAFETVLAVLDELDINELVFPLGGLLRRVALRIVREPEPEPPPVIAEPEPVAVVVAAVEARAKAPRRVKKPAPAPQAAEADATPELAPAPTAEPAPSPLAVEPSTPAPEPEPAPASEPIVVAAKPKPKPKPKAEPVPAPTPEPVPVPTPEPVSTSASAPKAVAEVAPIAAKSAPTPKAPAKTAASAAPPPAPKSKPAAKVPAKKPAAKPAAKAAAAKKPAAKPAAKRVAAKPAAKKAAKPAARPAKPAPKPAAKRVAAKPPARKAAAKKSPAKKAPVRANTAKKTAAKSTPARSAPARRGAPAKKTVKKTAAKRR
jgi:HisJ family histidinol phosphate phosphatase